MIQNAKKNRTRLIMIIAITMLFAAIWVVTSSAAALPPSTGNLGMVVDRVTGRATVFDANADTVLGSVFIGPSSVIGDCSITVDQSLGFATDFRSRVWVIDLTTVPPSLAAGTNPIPISNFGEDTSITPDQKFLVVSDGSGFQPISVVDIASRAEVKTFSLGRDHNSVEVLSDGSVLVTSHSNGSVHRLTIDGAGNLTDTGEALFGVSGPNNVFGSPSASSGVVVRRFSGQIQSFTIPGLSQVDVRPLAGSFGISGLVHPAGNILYVRTNGSPGKIEAYHYNSSTGKIGFLNYTTFISGTPTFFGMDQMAISPDGNKLYLSQPNAVNVYDAHTGEFLKAITDLSIVSPTGVCISPQIEIEIDIKPGSDPNSINCDNVNETITVAILTTDDFDATTVDHTTVSFEGADESHVDRRNGEPRRHEEDVDSDGDIDLVFHFRQGETDLTCTSEEGALTGETFDGQAIVGNDSVRMVNTD